MKQNISSFWDRNGIVWYDLFSTPTSPLFQTLLVNFCCRCFCHPCHCQTDQGREALSVQHTSLSGQRVKCSNCRHLSTQPSEKSWWALLQWNTNEEHLWICQLWETKVPLSDKVPPEFDVWIDLWYDLPKTWIELREPMLDEETHNPPYMPNGSRKHSSPKLPRGCRFFLPMHPPLAIPKMKGRLSYARKQVPL